jgi:hypothetical protein
MPYPIIVEGQSDALPSNVVAVGHSYSSSSLDHSLRLLEGQSRRPSGRALAKIDARAGSNCQGCLIGSYATLRSSKDR